MKNTNALSSEMQYSYIFPDLTDSFEDVRVIHHFAKREFVVGLKVNDGNFEYRNLSFA